MLVLILNRQDIGKYAMMVHFECEYRLYEVPFLVFGGTLI